MFSILFILPKVLAAPHPSMWPRSPRLWLTWPGLLALGPAPTLPPWHLHVGTQSATPWTPTAWWGASPVAPTTVSTWKPSAAPDTRRSADIADSHPVRRNTLNNIRVHHEKCRTSQYVGMYFYRSLLSNKPQALSYGQQHPEGAVALHRPSDTQPHSGSVRYRSKLHLHCSRWHQVLRYPGGNMWGSLQSCGRTCGAEWGQSELLSTQDLLG